MTSKTFRILLGTCLCMAFVLSFSGGQVVAGPYNPCSVPPVVGSAARPNAMIIMDYSGSMQFAAYFDYDAVWSGYYSSSRVAYPTTNPTTNSNMPYVTYDPANQYYGPFDTDTYYVYDSTGNFFKPADPQPVLFYNGTADTEDGGSGTLWLTVEDEAANPPTGISTGDIVAVYDLGKHKSLNGDGHEVVEVSGKRIRIRARAATPAWTWSGTADPPGYRIIKRITGNINDPGGVSGNVLNVSATTRVDAALQALIGGKATTVTGDTTNVYIQAQGCRRWVQENTNVNAEFYVRPATLQDPVQIYPDNYSDGTYSEKDIFISISGKLSGQLDDKDPYRHSKPMESYKFTLTENTRVTVKMQSTWSTANGVLIAIYDSAHSDYNDPKATDLNGQQCLTSAGSQIVTLTRDLGPGTYYLRLATANPAAFSGTLGSYVAWSNVPLEKNTDFYTAEGLNPADHQGQTLTKIGAIPWARVRIQVPAEQRKKQGLIQQAFAFVRFGFIYYKGDVKDHEGKILVGCDNTDMDILINALEGKQPASIPQATLDFTEVYPYYGTPTGPALAEIYDYFTQHDNSDNADNDYFVSASIKGTLRDPYYGPDTTGNPVGVPCRKSYALLISDGVWNLGVDPVNPAQQMHTGDLRPDNQESQLPGDQIVDIYTILAFSQDPQGANSMKAIAMYGSFKNDSTCGNDNFPYPRSGTPSDSKDFPWPVEECDPTAADCNPPGSCPGTPYYNVKCCKEWNAVWDRNNDGYNENKGSPDAYYKANNGKELQAALAAVFADVISRHASASAVATVSQELRSGDIIVRGVFDAADPDNVDAYLWRGHLEAFRPFIYNDVETYSFELDCNVGRLCMDMPGTDAPCPALGRNCFDCGFILSDSTTPSSRNVFTYDQVTKTQYDFDTTNITKEKLNVSTDAARDDLVNWVLGTEVVGLRDRTTWRTPPDATKPWRLGDIVYSTPVVLGPPGLGEVSRRDPNVGQFYLHRNDNIHRMKVVYVGANDGMLHAFVLGKYDAADDKWIYDPSVDAEIGTELWSYIPSNLLTELKALADTTYGHGGCVHRTLVDLAPRSWEVYIKSSDCPSDTDRTDTEGRCWRSVIVGGERGGGDVYFALDVTDPRNPKVLWEYPVLKNRVVVEVTTGTSTQECIQGCRANCETSTTCTDAKAICDDACYATWGYHLGDRWCRRSCRACYGDCTTAFNTCVAACEDDCTTACQSYIPGEKSYVPFRNAYESVKMFPMSWSAPFLGRIQIPANKGIKFYHGDPVPLDPVNGGLPNPATADEFDADNNRRAVVFMGGGIHVYDKEFDTIPTVEDRFKLALYWPFLLMMDIETGHNLFEYVWPIVVNRAADNFKLKIAGQNTIPYAMSDPVALDLWNQNDHVVGDDGFIDTVYVGDMNGYVYGIKFNLDSKKIDSGGNLVDNSDFGIQVDLWPTKLIDKADLETDVYRSDHQPITLAVASTFKKGSTATLNVVIGTGKYDDVQTGTDDKTDTARMSVYNLEDTIAMPDLSGAYEVYDVDKGLATNFKVAFQPKCKLSTGQDVTFNTGCTWAKVYTDASAKTTVCSDPEDLSTCVQVTGVGSSPDCCQKNNDTCVDPCYTCVYDFTLPADLEMPGERVVGKPLIAGGLVFLTGVGPPSDPCGWTGQGYLYAFSVDCVPLLDPKDVFGGVGVAVGATTSSPSGTSPGGVRVSLGSGVPSRPVLDSRGENIVIQMSDGSLKRQEVHLPGKPIKVKGWRSR